MQAHTEGSPVLAMQVGFNARNALLSCELAARGIPGPINVFEGPFGYFELCEGDYDLTPVVASLGRVWRIAEVAHKPFPSGRATHGMVDACLELRREHGLQGSDIAEGVARVPPLTHRLIARPCGDNMAPNYARLSGSYVAACALLHGDVGLEDFRNPALADPERLDLGRRIRVEVDDNPDPNALTPITVELTSRTGAGYSHSLETVYGNPARPMSEQAHLAKFRTNMAASAEPLAESAAEQVITSVGRIETVSDVAELFALLSP